MKPIRDSKELELIQKYGSGTSFWYIEYPHKSYWSDKFTEDDFKAGLCKLFVPSNTSPTLLYLHMPYCHKQCWFCTCRVEITSNYEMVKQYLKVLHEEIDLHRKFYDEHGLVPHFSEIHLGGGSPTYIQEKDFDKLMEKLSTLTDINNLTEFSIEIDPRRVNKDRMRYYHSRGINRISFGVQDLDLTVQKSINRVQPEQLTGNLLDPDIRQLFPHGVNFDILCGLPNQTRETFRKTMDKVVELAPDRISLFYMEFAPRFAKHQLLMPLEKLPSPHDKKILFMDALEILLKAGYIRTGYDHFAKATDAVALAKDQKKMIWNSFGSSPGRYTNIVGLGVHSYSTLDDYYSQNVYEIEKYFEKIASGHFPVFRGHKLDEDDILRRRVIQTLRVYFAVDFTEINHDFQIDFREYFRKELASMVGLIEDGVVELSEDGLKITELGQQFAQLVCRSFDCYVEKV